MNCCGAQHSPVVKPPFTFGCILWPGFKFSPGAHAGPRAAAVEYEGVGLTGVLVMLSMLSSSSQILASWPAATISPSTSRLTCQVPPPHHHVAHAGSENEVIAGRGAAC
jgi:hypothetical protein